MNNAHNTIAVTDEALEAVTGGGIRNAVGMGIGGGILGAGTGSIGAGPVGGVICGVVGAVSGFVSGLFISDETKRSVSPIRT